MCLSIIRLGANGKLIHYYYLVSMIIFLDDCMAILASECAFGDLIVLRFYF